MDNLALAYVTCDKYSHIWEEWYDGIVKHWGTRLLPYFCGEEKPCPWEGWEHLEHEAVPVEQWTTKLRKQIERIPEENIFVWLDDLVQQFDISHEFFHLYYDWFLEHAADALRIMERGSKSSYVVAGQIIDKPVYKLTNSSKYRVSFKPSIYKKDFLLEVLRRDESPWACELNSTGAFPERNIYAYHIDGWCINKIVN